MSVFEVIASNDEQAIESERRTAIAAQTRAKARFKKFVGKSANDDELRNRLALIDSNLLDLAQDTAEEYGGDANQAYLAATAVLGGGHASDCSCGFCENKGKGFGNDKDDDDESDEKDDGEEKDDDDKKESKTACACGCGDTDCKCSKDNPCGMDGCKHPKEAKLAKYHVAVEVDTGDNYQSETLDLGSTTGDEPWSDVGSPKIDKGKSGDVAGWDLDPIDVGSVRNKLENQDATDPADHNDPDFQRDLSSPIHTDEDPNKSVGPQDTDRTKTWTGTEGQADPVTSKFRNWTVVED